LHHADFFVRIDSAIPIKGKRNFDFSVIIDEFDSDNSTDLNAVFEHGRVPFDSRRTLKSDLYLAVVAEIDRRSLSEKERHQAKADNTGEHHDADPKFLTLGFHISGIGYYGEAI